MNCCESCFSDRHITRELFSDPELDRGQCVYCHSENVLLLPPRLLRDYFELLIGSYVMDEEGKLLVEWFKDDWELFSHPSMDIAHSKELLSEILDDGEIIRKKFKPKGRDNSASLELWEKFRYELMFQNRYFPETVLDLDRLAELFSYLIMPADELPVEWFRARVNRGDDAYPINEMGAPPKKLASHGRANPAGIPYLYLASDNGTAISEIRPHTGDRVSVAKVNIHNELKIVDLRNPRKSISPFVMADEDQLILLREDIDFLVHLGNVLTQPVLPSYAAIDYTPSQYLCEYVKQCDFDGVMYRSSVGSGVNVALFDTTSPVFLDVVQHTVSRISVHID